MKGSLRGAPQAFQQVPLWIMFSAATTKLFEEKLLDLKIFLFSAVHVCLSLFEGLRPCRFPDCLV